MFMVVVCLLTLKVCVVSVLPIKILTPAKNTNLVKFKAFNT
jgi:hypothetical protein